MVSLLSTGDRQLSFTSNEFKTFCEKNGVHRITSSPFHPVTNRFAGRDVRTIKLALKNSKGSIEERLIEFHTMYRIAPRSTTNESPSELLCGRSHFDILKPE